MTKTVDYMQLVCITHEAANRVPGSRGIAPFAFMMPALSFCSCTVLQR